MSTPEIKIESRVNTTKGIYVPWQKVERQGPIEMNDGRIWGKDREPKGTVLGEGMVFVPFDTLYALYEQGHWDSQFGSALILNDPKEALALEALGFAEEETRGGYHGTDKLRDWMKENNLA